MSTAELIKIGLGVVVFALCFAGNIHFKGLIKNGASNEDTKKLKSLKKRKKLCFAGAVIGIWFVIGVFVTWFSGRKSGMKIEFSMFGERTGIEFFGMKISQTTVITVAIVLIVAVLCLIFRLFVFRKFKEEPTGFQNVMELCVESVEDFCKKNVGAKAGESLAPYMFSLAIYLVLCAASELVGLRAPTSDLVVTFSMGLITFVLLNWFGFKKLGFAGRLKAMGGSMAAMRPIMIPLKMVSDVAVPISLACRLFGNMLGGMIVMELLKGALGGYAAGIPGIAGLYFNLFHPLIQAYIFITLSLTFIEEAMEGPEKQSKKAKKQSAKAGNN